MTAPAGVTRLAPSPTGALHLGNARTFLLNHLLAGHFGWRVRMRVEDIDGPRLKPGADQRMLEELAWLGLRWVSPIVYQSHRFDRYRAALRTLIDAGWAYPCTCSRKDIAEAASAPHESFAPVVYPGTCRDRFATAAEAEAATGRPVAWRLRVPDETVAFDDRVAGRREYDLAREVGDFVIYKNDGLPGYQLAVVLDDAESGVDAVVRGDDLLNSTARQIHVRRLLGLGPEPAYWHLPLVVGPDGKRLAKRHGDTRLDSYRSKGCGAPRVLGLLGYWSGLIDTRREASLEELQAAFDPRRIPTTPVTFTAADDDFLVSLQG